MTYIARWLSLFIPKWSYSCLIYLLGSACVSALQAIKEPERENTDLKNLATDIHNLICTCNSNVCIKLTRIDVQQAHVLAVKARNGILYQSLFVHHLPKKK